MQNLARGWLLLWSSWRCAFTAIACFGTEPMIVDDPDPVQLLRRCAAAELEAAHGRQVVQA